MRSEKSVRAYFRVATLFLAACLVAHLTRPAAAELKDLRKIGPSDERGATRASKPIVYVLYDGEEPERLPFASLDLIVSARKIWDDRFGIGKAGATPQLTGAYKKKTLFTLTFPDEIGKYDPEVRAHALVVRLDPSTKFPQVVLSTHGGGLPCCTHTKIATVGRSGQWQVIEADKQYLTGYDFRDVDGDGSWEIVGGDSSFIGKFDRIAQSFDPIRIYQLRSGKLASVTTRPAFRRELRKDLAFIEGHTKEKPELWHSNAFLAAWVATKINLGEGEAAWAKMLTNFDRSNDWGLSECTVELDMAPCPDDKSVTRTYPEALKRHLIKHGYKMNFAGLKMQ